MGSDFSRLRLVSILEGVSYILLLGVAMPLKYMFDLPMAVRVVGMGHGILFILLVLAIGKAHLKFKWEAGFSMLIFAASLVPFGAFWMDRRLRARDPEMAPPSP